MAVPKGVRVGGRAKGTPNKRTAAVKQAAQKTLETIVGGIEDAFDGDAHALLVLIYKNPANEMALRIDAAKAAIRYEKPALSSIEAKVDADVTSRVRKIERTIIDPLNPDAARVPAAPSAS